jgi:hypothetical protein
MANQAEAAEIKAKEIAYLRGGFEMCKLLLTSPRFNKPQQEIIREQASKKQEQLEALGVKFSEALHV